MRRLCNMCVRDAFGVKTGSCPIRCGRALMELLDRLCCSSALGDVADITIDLARIGYDKDGDPTWEGSWYTARAKQAVPTGPSSLWYVVDLRTIDDAWVKVSSYYFEKEVGVDYQQRVEVLVKRGTGAEDVWCPALLEVRFDGEAPDLDNMVI